MYSHDLVTKKVALVARENSEGIYLEPGYLVFVRNGNLMAQAFDASVAPHWPGCTDCRASTLQPRPRDVELRFDYDRLNAR